MATVSQIAPLSKLRIEKIAVLTDFSLNSDLALRYAAAFARGSNATLVLAHSYIPPYSVFAAPEVGLVYPTFHDLQSSLDDRLVNQTEAGFMRDLVCTTLLHEGTPCELLNELRDVDLIVVGTSGQTGLAKAALGSTAEAIFRSSTVPVLTVGPHCRSSKVSEIALNTVLYATDFSTCAAIALPYALSIAGEHNSNLVLLHVSQDKAAQFSFERVIASINPLERLEKLVTHSAAQDLSQHPDLKSKPTYVVRVGAPKTAIVEEAKNHNADLIVMGARGAGVFASALSHFSGGTAYHVAANADCPVLTIRKSSQLRTAEIPMLRAQWVGA